MFGIGNVFSKIEVCTAEAFADAIDGAAVADACHLIERMVKRKMETNNEKSRKWCDTNIGKAKRTLPCITPMAWFRGGVRSVKNAVPSGLNMLDVDHVDNPRELWEQVRGKMTYPVACVHVTPSTLGLRIIFVQPEGVSIEEAQATLARNLGVTYDGVTKDLARCSFLVPRNYFLHLDEQLMGFAEHVTDGIGETEQQETEQPETEQPVVSREETPVAEVENATYPEEYKGIPYAEIVSILMTHAGYDKEPVAGERNNAVYMLARNMRYICDFNVGFILSCLPDWGLPRHEVVATVESAVKSVRMAQMPYVMRDILQTAKKRLAIASNPLYNEAFEFEVKAEGIIGELVRYQPPYLRNAAYLTCMVCFGTLLTRLRGYGPDGSVLAPNFMLTVSAPQASGKSFMKRIAEMILAPIKEEDDKQRRILTEIERENKLNKDKEAYEQKEFDGAIRLLPSNTSNRILLERMDKAKGQHLMIIAEEIDSMTKAERSGKWSEKSDIYRLAYDNSEWGQDYASDNSYRAVVRLFLNLLFSGTPAAVNRFFNDIENGLITRFLFIDLPDTFGQKRPKLAIIDRETKQRINDRVKRAYEHMNHVNSEDGLFWMDTTRMNEDALALYDEVQRRMYLVNQQDVCRDLARRRYCNYVVAMMMVETYLNDGVYTQTIRDRVIAVMNLCTEQLIATFGDAINASLNESAEKQDTARRRSQKMDCFTLLPNLFTAEDYKQALADAGQNTKSYTVYLTRLVKGGKIERLEKGLYRKLKD